jgi:hypothetical protein
MIDRVRIPEGQLAAPPHHRPGETFLKGPVPMVWLAAAMALPGRALHVGIGLWFEAGLCNSAAVKVNLSRFPFDRSAASRGLAALERAGLVRVARVKGRTPRVTIVAVNTKISALVTGARALDQEPSMGFGSHTALHVIGEVTCTT